MDSEKQDWRNLRRPRQASLAPAWASLSALGSSPPPRTQGGVLSLGAGGVVETELMASSPFFCSAQTSRRQSLAFDGVVIGPGGGDFCHLHVLEK